MDVDVDKINVREFTSILYNTLAITLAVPDLE